VKETSIHQTELKKDWELSYSPFHQLLKWFDEGEDSSGQKYLDMRRRLVLYFDRKNCLSPDELADETFNRVARRLEEEGAIVTDSPAHYCDIVARFVLLEALRKQQREESLDERLLKSSTPPGGRTQDSASTVEDGLTAYDELREREQRWSCLESCISALEPHDRQLIINYYRGDQRAKIENRTAIAAQMGLTKNALSIRACRIRDKLDVCVKKCLEAAG